MTPIGGPGAVYKGKLEDLVGPALAKDLGDKDGNVPLDALQRHSWIYESDYYKKLIEKAKLDNPTKLVTRGEKFKIQFVCLARPQPPCKVRELYFAANVLKRTEGQVEITISSYPELGLAGPEILRLVTDGTLSASEVYGGFVAGDLPVADIFYFFGLYSDHQTEFKAQQAILPDIDKIFSEATKGGVVISHNWYSGNDQYILSKKPLRTPADFKGTKLRAHNTTSADALIGLGAEAQFMTPADVYTAVERGIVEGTIAGPTFAFNQRWYEVTKYVVGPYRTFPATFNLINKGVWDKLPPDLQQILIEEGARQELEALRMSPPQNETGLSKLVDKGMEYIPFSPELMEYAFENAIIKRMIPGWAKRTGGANSDAVKLFNDKVAPIAGIKINPDGTVSRITTKY